MKSGWENVILSIYRGSVLYVWVPAKTSEGAFFTFFFAREFAGALGHGCK